MSDDELKEAVTSPGVQKIKRFGEKGKAIGIHFSGQAIPEHVLFWGELSFPVKKYAPPPTKCFRCQGYGHVSRTCRGLYTCYKCAFQYEKKDEHDTKECKPNKEDEKCINCGEEYLLYGINSATLPTRQNLADQLHPQL